MKISNFFILTLLASFIGASCEKEESKTDPISITLQVTDVSINGNNDGAIVAEISGGKDPLSVLWSNGDTSQNISGLIAGEYILTVTDGAGEIETDTALIAEPEALVVNLNQNNPTTVEGNDGAIQLTIQGGVEPYDVSWSNGESTEGLEGLSAGTYICEIWDANQAYFTDTINLVDPLNIVFEKTDATYFDAADGAIEVEITGGMEPYEYKWNYGSLKEDVRALRAGEYILVVTDAAQQKDSIEVTISQPEKLYEEIEFPSLDGLDITANLYHLSDDAPVILLCHMDGSNRGEYKRTATILYDLGYTSMAIDQRRGSVKNGMDNETAKRATEKGLPTEYADAEQDIIAAVDYLNNKYKKQIIIFGSSYSAGYCFKVAMENDKVSVYIGFSVYYDFVANEAGLDLSLFTKPAFLTSTKSEATGIGVNKIYNAISSQNKVHFVPSGGEGSHGSNALVSNVADEYWDALKLFLDSL